MGDEQTPWVVKGVPAAIRRKVKVYAAEHDMTMSQSVEALVEKGLSNTELPDQDGVNPYQVLLDDPFFESPNFTYASYDARVSLIWRAMAFVPAEYIPRESGDPAYPDVPDSAFQNLTPEMRGFAKDYRLSEKQIAELRRLTPYQFQVLREIPLHPTKFVQFARKLQQSRDQQLRWYDQLPLEPVGR